MEMAQAQQKPATTTVNPLNEKLSKIEKSQHSMTKEERTAALKDLTVAEVKAERQGRPGDLQKIKDLRDDLSRDQKLTSEVSAKSSWVEVHSTPDEDNKNYHADVIVDISINGNAHALRFQAAEGSVLPSTDLSLNEFDPDYRLSDGGCKASFRQTAEGVAKDLGVDLDKEIARIGAGASEYDFLDKFVVVPQDLNVRVGFIIEGWFNNERATITARTKDSDAIYQFAKTELDPENERHDKLFDILANGLSGPLSDTDPSIYISDPKWGTDGCVLLTEEIESAIPNEWVSERIDHEKENNPNITREQVLEQMIDEFEYDNDEIDVVIPSENIFGVYANPEEHSWYSYSDAGDRTEHLTSGTFKDLVKHQND